MSHTNVRANLSVFGGRIKDYCAAAYKEHPLITVFNSGMLFFIFLCILMNILTNGMSSYFSMFPDKNDIFMDYFNSIYYSMNGPYTEFKVIYPPFITVIYEMIGNWITIDHPPADGFDIRDSYTGLFSYVLLTVIAIVLINYLLFKRFHPKMDKNCYLPIILLLISFPIIFTIMRGNCIIYSLIFVTIFIFGYKSENDFVRCFAYICLGLAAGIKIYLAIFGLLVLREKNVKDLVTCVLIGLVIVFVPFLMTDGTPLIWFENAFGYALTPTWNGIINIGDCVEALGLIGASNNTISIVTVVLCLLLYAIIAALLFFRDDLKNWEMIGLLSISVIIGFGPPTEYSLIFLIPVIMMFFVEENVPSRRNLFIAFIFVLVMMLFPSFTNDSITRTTFVSIKGISTMVLLLIILNGILKKERNTSVDECPSAE